MELLRTSHDAWALFKKMQLLHRLEAGTTAEQVEDARAFAREVKAALLLRLGLEG
jgi:hypothetical protein